MALISNCCPANNTPLFGTSWKILSSSILVVLKDHFKGYWSGLHKRIKAYPGTRLSNYVIIFLLNSIC